MKKAFIGIFYVCILFWFTAAHAQQDSCTSGREYERIIGRIVDENEHPIEYANIALLSVADSSFVTGGISDSNGDFVIQCEMRDVLARVSFVGYKTTHVSCGGGDIGTIRLVPEAIVLDGVTVRSSLPQIRLMHDAMVTTVAGTVLEKSGTVEDLLGNIPMVDADNGRVEVFGRGAAEIYINGRKLQDNTELQQLSSENVQHVEVVNNPGARYSASTKAVIRIKTKRPQGDGFGFTETAEIRYNRGWRGLHEQVDMNYRYRGLDISGRVFGKRNTEKEYFSNILNTYLTNHWYQEAHTTQNTMTRRGLAMIQANYVVDDNSSLGMRYEFTSMPGNETWGTFSSKLYQDNIAVESNKSNISVASHGHNHSANIYYIGKIGKWGIDFNADGVWNVTKGHSNSDENTSSGTDRDDNRNVKSESIGRNSLLASKLVVGHPLFGGDLCLGVEMSCNTRNSGYTDESGLTVNDKSKVRERIMAGFVEYRYAVGRVNATAGLRYEKVNSDYYLYGVRQNEQSRRYYDLFPSVSLSTNIGRVYMQLSYANDISRPSYSSLSSAVTYINRYTYEGGNPLLKPVYTRTVVLNASYKWWLLAVGYKHVKDDCANIFKPYNGNPSIAYSQLENIAPYGQLFCSLSASPNIGDIWFPRITAMLQAQNYTADTPWGAEKFNRPQFTLKWNNTVRLPWKLRFEAKINFSTSGDYTTYRMNKCHVSTFFTLRRDFLNERLNVQIKASDLFKTDKTEGYVYSSSHVFKFLGNVPHTVVTMRAVYKFNAARDKYKGKGAGNAEKNRL